LQNVAGGGYDPTCSRGGKDLDLRRGLPGGDSLAKLLRRARGLRERRGGDRTRGKAGGLPAQAGRRQVARLLARGLPLAEVARRLGVSRQRVHQLARYDGRSHPP
jgi:hypothetical protein